MHMIAIRHAMSKYGIELDQEYTMQDSYETIFKVREWVEAQIEKRKKDENRELIKKCVEAYITETGEKGRKELANFFQTAMEAANSANSFS